MVAERKTEPLQEPKTDSGKIIDIDIYRRGMRLAQIIEEIKEINKGVSRRQKWEIFIGDAETAERRRKLFFEKIALDQQQKIARRDLRGRQRLV